MAQAPRPTSKRPARKTPVKPAKVAVKKSPPPTRNWRDLIPDIRKGTTVRIVVLLIIVVGIFAFNPQSGIVNQNSNNDSNTTKSYKIDIRNRTLADPHQGDLKLKVSSHAILEVTTDEDGRLDLVSESRDVFNPVFSNVGNTLSIPTDRAESFRLEFHPASASGADSSSFTIGTVIVQD